MFIASLMVLKYRVDPTRITSGEVRSVTEDLPSFTKIFLYQPSPVLP